MKHLDRDRLSAFLSHRQEDGGHPAAAKLPLDPVAPREGRTERDRDILHGLTERHIGAGRGLGWNPISYRLATPRQ